MDYIEKIVELVNDVALNAMSGNYDKYDRSRELVIEILGWKSMDTAPRDRKILVYAYSSADHPESDERHYLAVKWNPNWKQWYVLGYALDRDGSSLYAIDPIKWMEIEDDN